MYKPNFCAQCGQKVLRLKSHFWTSRRFCDGCARALRKERIMPWLLATVLLTSFGYIAGSSRKTPPPPLTIIRRSDSPLSSREDSGAITPAAVETQPSTASNEEEVYLCGAQTKKGTPCSRRVHGLVRCWQHKGARAMMPTDKLRIKDDSTQEQKLTEIRRLRRL